ncbi:hypothetical protein HELRODRAFT_170395 [Helobdella robusta]|uniref:Uncharacterized protein n=1 Tax=Helobdella robusta TaxID=6412 RepID=T1F302_HELRO|nr:hypothetical protein HELRODRAFT_170395 [Helobdella robusta]ESO07096.1 hypothetical protein HELRODRAFT_170395 [Helobdella robusta]
MAPIGTRFFLMFHVLFFLYLTLLNAVIADADKNITGRMSNNNMSTKTNRIKTTTVKAPTINYSLNTQSSTQKIHLSSDHPTKPTQPGKLISISTKSTTEQTSTEPELQTILQSQSNDSKPAFSQMTVTTSNNNVINSEQSTSKKTTTQTKQKTNATFTQTTSTRQPTIKTKNTKTTIKFIEKPTTKSNADDEDTANEDGFYEDDEEVESEDGSLGDSEKGVVVTTTEIVPKDKVKVTLKINTAPIAASNEVDGNDAGEAKINNLGW